MATLTPHIIDVGSEVKCPVLDRADAGVLAVGGTVATSVEVGRTGQATTVHGSLTVTQAATFTAAADFDAGMTVAAGQSIDGDGALDIDCTGALGIGDTNATSVGIGRAGVTTTIAGDLLVQGTTTHTDSINVLVSDNHIYLNHDYETAVAQTGGLVVNYLPIATTDTANGAVVAGIAATSNPTMITTGSATFAVGQFIQIANANTGANNGLFEVLTHTGTTLTIRGIGTVATVEDFTQNQFTADASDTAATITRVTVSVLRAGTDGIWETGSGSTTAISFSNLATGAGNSLQAAYAEGNTITMTDANGGFDVSVTSGNPIISLDAAGNSNFSVANSGSTLTLEASGGSTNQVIINSAGTGTDAIDLNASAGGVTITGVGINLAGGSSEIDLTTTGTIDINGDTVTIDSATGGVTILGAAASSFTSDSSDLTLATTTSGNVRLDPVSGTVTSSATVLQLDEGFTIQCGGAAGGIDLAVVGTGQLTTDATSFTASAAFDVIATTGDQGLTSTAGSVVITGNEAVADSIQLTAGNAAGGVDINAGGTSGVVTIDAGGAISIGGDADTGAINVGTGGVRTITIGNVAATEVQIDALLLDVNVGATGITINTSGTMVLGTAGSSEWTNISGNMLIRTVTTGTIDIDAVGAMSLNTAGSSIISIGNDATAGAINIGTGAAARNTTIGNSTGATSIVLNVGTGNLDVGVNATAHEVRIGSATGASGITMNTGTGGIDIGTNAIAATVALGNSTGATAVTIDAGSGGVSIDATGASNFSTTSGAITIDPTAALNLGPANATSVAIGANDIGTTVVGWLNVGTASAAAVGDFGAGDATRSILYDASAGSFTNTETNGGTWAMKTADTLLATTTGSSVTASSLIPIGALVLSVLVNVETLIVGPTTWNVGDGSDTDRWGASLALAQNTSTNPGDFGDNTISWQGSSAGDVVLTVNGADFSAGAVRVVVTYMECVASAAV